MKKQVLFLLTAVLVSSNLFASGQKDAAAQNLTVYGSHSTEWTIPIIGKFQDGTGIRVNLVHAGTGDLFARLETEKDAPLADALWGGGSDSYQADIGLLQPYAQKHMNKVSAVTRDPGNRWHGTTIDPMVIIHNPKLVAAKDAPKGWADLLNPAFKGKSLMPIRFIQVLLSWLSLSSCCPWVETMRSVGPK